MSLQCFRVVTDKDSGSAQDQTTSIYCLLLSNRAAVLRFIAKLKLIPIVGMLLFFKLARELPWKLVLLLNSNRTWLIRNVYRFKLSCFNKRFYCIVPKIGNKNWYSPSTASWHIPAIL